jgi:hypothetical protein
MAAALSLVFLSSGCHRQVKQARAGNKDLPPVILWAWERPELEFLNSQRFGVAFWRRP